MAAVGSGLPYGFWFKASSVLILAAGSMFTLWLGERITDKGVGNGISFIILIGIIARLPQSFAQEFQLTLPVAWSCCWLKFFCCWR